MPLFIQIQFFDQSVDLTTLAVSRFGQIDMRLTAHERAAEDKQRLAPRELICTYPKRLMTRSTPMVTRTGCNFSFAVDKLTSRRKRQNHGRRRGMPAQYRAGVRSGPHSAPTLLGYLSEDRCAEGLCESRHGVRAALLASSCLPESDDRVRATGASMSRGCCNNTATSHQNNILRPERRDRSITVRKPARGGYK